MESFDTFSEPADGELRNQDPLAALDSTQFVELLATFSNRSLTGGEDHHFWKALRPSGTMATQKYVKTYKIKSAGLGTDRCEDQTIR